MQCRSGMVFQLLQAWKAQPVFVSVIGCNGLGDITSAMARSMVAPASSLPHVRLFSSKNNANTNTSAAGGGNSSAQPGADSSLWSSLRRSLFPVGLSKPPSPSPSASSSPSHPSGTAASSWQRRGSGPAATSTSTSASPAAATAATVAASREARAAERRGARVKEDAFKSLSKDAERFSGTLLKAAVLLITVPLAIHMLSHSLMLSLCVRGLEAERPETVALTLRRVRSVVVSDFLAARFDGEEGVALMLATFIPGANEAVLREFIATAQQLLKFESTREALLMSSLVQRLERAQSAGWLPEELREPARQLYLDAHASLRMGLEAEGPAETAAAGGGAKKQ